MLLKYPRPKKGETRWYVYAHPDGKTQHIWRVKITDARRAEAEYVVDEVLIDKGPMPRAAPGDKSTISYINRLPDSVLEAKKLFVHLSFSRGVARE